ncbi:MAG TPA: hypothetical protein DDW52_24700 [Planctomycetaceae bacterium]|nr:hypothetical protein [Planctomycetaceae bacterium]
MRVRVHSPPEAANELIQAVTKLCDLRYGEYDSVAWISSTGEEQFRPLLNASPAQGQTGKLSKLPSVAIEFSIPNDTDLLERVVIEAILPNHPWERPVIRVSTESEVLL